MTKEKRNRLGSETSPYLKQHATNPVDWYPWGPEALKKAKAEDKPIFLSIGYSACHWCHVMERESFEDEATAKILNESFINIKVDREERPDLDHIYMTAVQVMTQRGGWPMSVFLTPDLRPFYGGTYFPPEDRMGMPSFKRVVGGVIGAWKGRKKEILETASQLMSAVEEMQKSGTEKSDADLDVGLVESAVTAFAASFDPRFGGFGTAPKFFHTAALRLMLRHAKSKGASDSLEKVTFTLHKLARGGIYDQLGGGFHRYSTDEQWLVPHFEKMLYDNALLAQLYLEGFQATKDRELARTASETLDYTLREMTAPQGGFYSTQDADSDGEEGKFYVWSREEVTELLDRDLSMPFNTVFNVTPAGNWEGKSILQMKESLEETAQHLGEPVTWLEDKLAVAKRKLYTGRAKRKKPHRDEKVVTAWNGLMIEAMALGGCVLGDTRFTEAAEKAANFILEKMRGEDGKSLLHTYKDGRARLSAYLDDYGAMINACLSLFECEGKARWLDAAKELAEIVARDFWDASEGAFYYTGTHHEKLITRPRENQDGAVPSGAGLAITGLLRLGLLTSDPKWSRLAETALKSQARLMKMAPMAAGQFLIALSLLLDRPKEIVVFPGSSEDLYTDIRDALWSRFLPNRVILFAGDPGTAGLPLLKDRGAQSGKTTVYVCESFACQAPVQTVEALEKTLDEA